VDFVLTKFKMAIYYKIVGIDFVWNALYFILPIISKISLHYLSNALSVSNLFFWKTYLILLAKINLISYCKYLLRNTYLSYKMQFFVQLKIVQMLLILLRSLGVVFVDLNIAKSVI